MARFDELIVKKCEVHGFTLHRLIEPAPWRIHSGFVCFQCVPADDATSQTPVESSSVE